MSSTSRPREVGPSRRAERAPRKIVVLGSMCRLPVPGVALQLLHYLLGFDRLGFESYYVEWHGNWVADPTDPRDRAGEPRLLVDDVMRRFGFASRWTCRADQNGPGQTFGPLAAGDLPALYRDAVAVVNVTGAHIMEGAQLECPRRVYVESDPGLPQVRLHQGDLTQRRLIDGHTHFFTFGESVAAGTSDLPATGVPYRPTRQPIVVDLWRDDEVPAQASGAWTTISRWRKGKSKVLTLGGERFEWDKDGQFLDYLSLPARVAAPLELALSGCDEDDARRLRQAGWRVVDAMDRCLTIDGYRSYIGSSRGEFTIAKDQYVRLRTGWFSDRTACYLAMGKPAVTQETGFSGHLPVGEGLFSFEDEAGILAAFDAIEGNYGLHSRRAREVARAYFDSDVVLSRLLEEIGVDHDRPEHAT